MGFFDTLMSGAKVVAKEAGNIASDMVISNIPNLSNEKLFEHYSKMKNNRTEMGQKWANALEKEMEKRGLI